MKRKIILVCTAVFFLASMVPAYAGGGKGGGSGKGQGTHKQLRLRDGSCGGAKDGTGKRSQGQKRQQNKTTQQQSPGATRNPSPNNAN